MTVAHYIAMGVVFALLYAGGTIGQIRDAVKSETAPPSLVVLVYQRFPFDKTAESGKALAAVARVCANLEVPNSWIVSDSVTGEPELLSFDPFDSFAHIDKAFAEWGPLYAAHPELGKWQAQINGALESQRTIVAVRRDDLSYRANRIDLSKAFPAGSRSSPTSRPRGGVRRGLSETPLGLRKSRFQFAMGGVLIECGGALADIFCICAHEDSGAER